MTELVTEAFLSAVFEKLFERLGSQVFANFFRGKKSIDEQRSELKRKLRRAHLLINDAEERQIAEKNVRKWLDDLKDVTHRAEDLVEDIDAEARSKQETDQSGSMSRSMLMRYISPDQSNDFDKTVQSELALILEDLDDLLERVVVLGLKHGSSSRKARFQPILPAPLREEHHVYGREADRENILKALLSDVDGRGNKISVLPIVGMGGLGKTTLAQLVYYDTRVKKHDFELKAWVTVSTEFDVFRIMKTILQQVNSQVTSDTEEPAELQRRLKEDLGGKKFIFVLDDVWDDDYSNWDFLKSTFQFGGCGSRVIVTTRSQKVASMVTTGPIYHLEYISDDDCWKIFVAHAFNGDSSADQHFQEMGKRLVQKCRGLPLAIKSLGSLLRSEKSSSRVWECMGNDTLRSLWLSYHYLPSSLKQCFAYCSIFPKNFEFAKEKLILLWMAEGFLQVDHKEKRMEDIGEEYFNNLISRSLFQRSSRDESRYVMHDLVHDLAMFVSGEFCFRFENEGRNLKHLTSRTRHLSHNISIDYVSWTNLSKAKHLRTFMSLFPQAYVSNELVENLITKGRYLRVLSPSRKSSISMLLHPFSNLKHLRYLDLTGSIVDEIPCSICTLHNLQTLLLSNCERLTRLPKDMGRLVNLRHLDTSGSPLIEMPPQMGNLKELQTLTNFVLGENNSGSSIKELGALQHLGGKLLISGLQNVDNPEDVLKACLMDKVNLTELALEWKDDTTDIRKENWVLSALRPHINLKKLSISAYTASSFPKWVGDCSFSVMVSIYLSAKHHFCHSLPPLGQLPSLRELVVKSFHGVERIDAEFYGKNSVTTAFQSLETLEFYDMQAWKVWSFIDQEGKKRVCFPRLKQLRLQDCLNLTGSLSCCETIETHNQISDSCDFEESIPLDHFPMLKKLVLEGCETLKRLSGNLPNVIEAAEIVDCNKLHFQVSYRFDLVSELMIQRCDSLQIFPLDYFPGIKCLVLEECQNLESIAFTEENGTSLHTLNSLRLVDCKNFKSLPKHMCKLLPSLASIQMVSCPEMESFPEGGLPSSLNRLEISNCHKLIVQHKRWHLQQLVSLASLSISKCDMVLDSFPEGLLPVSLTSFELEGLPHLQSLNGGAFRYVASLHTLSLSYCNELPCLPEELLPTSLHSLWINECPYLERRYRRVEGDDWHKISHIPKISIYGKPT